MYRSHPNFFKSWYRSFIACLIDLISGLLGVLSLGLFTNTWEISYMINCHKKDISDRIQGKLK